MAESNPNQALLDALRHPLRRNLLKRYIESSEKLSPNELARLERKSLSNVSYHVRVLAKCGAIELVDHRHVRGSVEHFYRASNFVKETHWVLATLGLEG